MNNAISHRHLALYLSGIVLGFCLGWPNGHLVGTLQGQVQSYERVVGDMQQLTAAAAPAQEKTLGARPKVKSVVVPVGPKKPY